MDFVESVLTGEQLEDLKKIKFDERLAKFERKHVTLGYNDRYPINTVFLRMPINADTTVEDVESFFVRFAELFRDQRQQDVSSEKINDYLSL